MDCRKVTYRLHAIEQMFARSIAPAEVSEVILRGEIIASYPTDKPYPSALRMALVNGRPIHIVVAQDETGECFVITAYEPDTLLWNPDFKTRK